MAIKQDDGLFLLEVLIEKVVFVKSPCFSDKDFRTCVNIECQAVEPLEICDDDRGACVAQSGGPFVKTFNNGKSCLFSLKEADITKAMSKFPIKVSVYKSLPCGCLPTKIVMGEATIDMTKEFVQARKKFLEDPATVSYQALKDSFRIIGPDGGETGDIVMFLRISCFGKLIITRFQGSGGPSNLGVGGNSAIVDRSCNPRKDFQSSQDPCACGVARSAGAASGVAGGPPCASAGGNYGGTCPLAKDPYNTMPCEANDDPCYCSGPKPPVKPPMLCRNTDQYCLHVPKGRTKQFEEIGTKLAGNELKIKVPAGASIIKKISQTHCAMQCPYVKGKDAGPCEPPCGKNQISLGLPSEATCCAGAQPADTQFTCTTEGCVTASKHGQQAALARGDTRQQELPNRDVFVLKVGKTAMQGDRKCKLELELVTPKGPDKKPPVKKISTRMQSEPDCECCKRRVKKEGRNCCPVGNKVIFQLPSDSCGMGHKQRAYFNFTSDGVGDVTRDDSGQLAQTTAEDYPGVVYDFPKQVIKLRIGTLPRLPFCQELSEVQKLNLKTSSKISSYNTDADTRLASRGAPNKFKLSENNSEAEIIVRHSLNIFLDNLIIPSKSSIPEPIWSYSSNSNRLQFKKSSVIFSDSVNTVVFQKSSSCLSPVSAKTSLFNKKETAVYMTLFDEFYPIRSSGTQATAFINKCLQVSPDYDYEPYFSKGYNNVKTNNYSSSSMSTQRQDNRSGILRYSDVYFFGRKSSETKPGIGTKDSKTKLRRSGQITAAPVKSEKGCASVQAKCQSSCSSAQTKKAQGSSAATCTGKSVSIKDPSPGAGAGGQQTTHDMVATVSHIRIGPREPCSVCQSPKCIIASSGNEQSAPVKITTATNPRRGVFELVVRRLTGAPLAKNELMLEWTPPPSQPLPCGSPRPGQCSSPPCRPSSCKMIVCRPSPCKPKCCKKGCKKPCGPTQCKKSCGPPKSCRPCKPCPPSKCRQCSPSPCGPPCALPCCELPCSSPCPVGRKRTRRARSQPLMKAHKRRSSPCANRSKKCPVVKCRSISGPCIGCCGSPPGCPPRKCCSVSPCQPLRRCKSYCSTCC